MATTVSESDIDGTGRIEPFELLLFATDPDLVSDACRAGVDGVIVDWERRGKLRRQAGEGTQINSDTLADLERVRSVVDSRILTRINGFGHWTRREVDQAVDAGTDEILLPMVREAGQVDATLRYVDGRCGVGILVETVDGVRATPELARHPLSRVYVGLNDLRIDRRSTCLFAPLVDGTVEQVARDVAQGRPAHARPRFGVAGLTLPDRGVPVPSRLLAAELMRLRADFTFLRRSFLADTGGRDLEPAVRAIREELSSLSQRAAHQELADHDALSLAVAPTARTA